LISIAIAGLTELFSSSNEAAESLANTIKEWEDKKSAALNLTGREAEGARRTLGAATTLSGRPQTAVGAAAGQGFTGATAEHFEVARRMAEASRQLNVTGSNITEVLTSIGLTEEQINKMGEHRAKMMIPTMNRLSDRFGVFAAQARKYGAESREAKAAAAQLISQMDLSGDAILNFASLLREAAVSANEAAQGAAGAEVAAAGKSKPINLKSEVRLGERCVSRSVARTNLDLSERAGAKVTPWQRQRTIQDGAITVGRA
jgi:hypothetical protein